MKIKNEDSQNNTKIKLTNCRRHNRYPTEARQYMYLVQTLQSKVAGETCPHCKMVGSCKYFRYLILITTLAYNLVSSIVVANAVNIIYSLHLSCQMHNTGIPEFTPGV
jgi:hypothetical protein